MNNYGNSEPKILKTLNSSGQVLNDSGEVISDTSDYWEKVYNEAEPKPDKILYSDGTIKDSAGNLIQDTTEFNVKKYNQAEPIPAKYLHSDGTIDENPGSGGSGITTLYCWYCDDGSYAIYTTSATPSVGDGVIIGDGEYGTPTFLKTNSKVVTYSDNTIKIDYAGLTNKIFERYADEDIILTNI